MSEVRKVVLGCTDRDRHQWTTLFTINYHGQVEPGEDVVQWVPTLPGSWFEPGPCPRCRRNPRLGHERLGLLLESLEQDTREEPGRVRLDISFLPF
jgi:hypothetical protein